MRFLLIAIAALLGLGSATAHAQRSPEDAAAAEALFEEGRTLMKQGAYGEACEKFAASHELDASIGALLNLGDCRERLGQTASAWAYFREAAALAHRVGDRRREEFALERAQRLHDRLSYLVIEVPEESLVQGLSVHKNGEPVEQAMWNQRAPVDPGRYVIRAEAPGHRPLEVRVEVAGEADKVTVTIKGLKPMRDRSRVETEVALTREPEPGVVEVRMNQRRVLALAAGGAGVVGLAVGAGFGLAAGSRWDQAMAYCDDSYICTQEGYDLGNQARRLGSVANLSFGLGAAALLTGTVLWFTSSSDEGDVSGAEVTPSFGPDAAGVSVQMSF